MSERRSGRLRQALIGGVAVAALGAGLARAQQADISVPAQPLSQTLKEISRQTGDNILFTPDAVAGVKAPALSGKMTSFDAVTRALSGTDLEAVPDGSGGIVIRRMAQKKTVLAEQPAETIVVTGSRIPQTNLTSPSPVTIVGRPEFVYAGATDVTKVINDLPSVFPSQNANVSNGATGTDNINLRDLGPQRNLVLIDGSRLMPGDPTIPAGDINTIPAALVDHIEILTGGASAVYGSDALAGAVNFILRRDFEGIEADGTYSITQNDNATARWRNLIQDQINLGVPGFAEPAQNVWNGQTEDAQLIMGVNSDNGKGNMTAYLGYRSMAAVLESTRDTSECSLQLAGKGDICQGSPNYNAWFSLDDYYDGDPYFFFETGTGKTGSGRFVPFTFAPNQFYNFAATNYFQRPDTRYTGGFFAHYDVDRHVRLFADLMIADDHTVAQIAPAGLFLGSGSVSGYAQEINCSNPYMTAQENHLLCGQTPGSMQQTIITGNGMPFTYWDGSGNLVPGQSRLEIGRRDIEGGARQSDLRHTSYRMKAGATGDLGSGWTYDLYAQEGYTQFSDISTGNFSTSRAQNALEVDPVTGKCFATESGTAPTCVPLDIFNGIGSITPAMANYVAAAAMQQGSTEEKIVSGSMNGDLGEWGVKSPWAQNAVLAVLGGEYRQETLAYLPDEEFRTGDIEGGGVPVLAVPAAGFHVAEGFTELQLPLVQNAPAIEDLTLKGGYRFSSYSRAGDTNTWYGAAEWQPVDDMRFRASMQHAVRAPNVVELFTPPQISQFLSSYPGSDPCATITTGQCANVPNAGTQLLFCPTGVCNDQIGGNPFLKPESSNTRTAGIVITPSFLDGFSATIDWWNIDVTHYISTIPVQETLDECYGPPATPQSEAFFCPFVHRSPNGTLYGPGYVASDSINTGYLKTSGVDFSLNYQTDTQDWFGVNEGSLSLSVLGTWLNTLLTDAVPATPLTAGLASRSNYNCAGLFGQTCGSPAAKWRHKLRVTWASPFDVQISLQWRYIGATSLDADTSTRLIGGGPGLTQCGNFSVAGTGDCQDAHISSYSYFDLAAAWTVRAGVELRAGVNNVFDIEPPVLSVGAVSLGTGNGNTYTGGYDVLGRTLFVSATVKY